MNNGKGVIYGKTAWMENSRLIDTGCPENGALTTYYLIEDEKDMEKNFQTKTSIIAKMIVQSKQRYTRTSLPCSVAVVIPKLLNSLLSMQNRILVVSDLVLCDNAYRV
jgi:hypothetical protein